jgi:lipid-binding SYLF domain-containing protein
MTKFNILSAVFAGATLLFPAASFAKDGPATKRITEADSVLHEIMDTNDKSIPQDLLDKAQCIVIVPGLKKGAFIIGGKFGKGFVSCRGENGVGWSAPAGIRVEGGSFGFQIGGSETDVIMLVLNERGMDKLLSNKFTVGADASVAAGPVGRTASAETDAALRAEILTWSRARGVFAGIALNGATLRPDEEGNIELYGKNVENKDIVSGKYPTPEIGQKLLSSLNKYSSRKTK